VTQGAQVNHSTVSRTDDGIDHASGNSSTTSTSEDTTETNPTLAQTMSTSPTTPYQARLNSVEPVAAATELRHSQRHRHLLDYYHRTFDSRG